jgi:integrase-like protein/Arm domain-containing DNA-binding protein
MPINLLTTVKCRAAICAAGWSLQKLHDGGGLYLWVYSDGRKYWCLRYWRHGKEKSLSLGVFGITDGATLKEARTKRDELRKQLEDGLDPSAERKAKARRERSARTNPFEAVAAEWFTKRSVTWVESHTIDVKRRLEANIYPTLGQRPIAEIDAPELLAAVRRIESRGSHDLAHRVLQVCGQVFRYEIATGKCSRDLPRIFEARLLRMLKSTSRQ